MNDPPTNVVPLAAARRQRELRQMADALARARRERSAGGGAVRRAAPGRFRPRRGFQHEELAERRHARALLAAWIAALMATTLLALGALLLRP
jgi:hypothetical protein